MQIHVYTKKLDLSLQLNLSLYYFRQTKNWKNMLLGTANEFLLLIIGLVQPSKVTNPIEQFIKQKMNGHPRGKKSNIKDYFHHFNRLSFHFFLVEWRNMGRGLLGMLSPLWSLDKMFSSCVRTKFDSFVFKDKCNDYIDSWTGLINSWYLISLESVL